MPVDVIWWLATPARTRPVVKEWSYLLYKRLLSDMTYCFSTFFCTLVVAEWHNRLYFIPFTV
jgi:hypothetical protein